MKKIVFIKCGGSFITDKKKPYTEKTENITLFAKQLKEAITTYPDIQFVLGNGAGSYGHYAVMQYNLKNGIQKKEAWQGFSYTHHMVSVLHMHVLTALWEENISVFSLQPSALFTAYKGDIVYQSQDVFMGFIKQNVIPCVYGDILYDEKKGCHIASTEVVFEVLINALLKKKYRVAHIIYLTTVPGVYDKEGSVIPQITFENYEKVSTDTLSGYDVTGGMKHKIERALYFAEKGITSYIGTITKDQTLSDIISGAYDTGTVISSS